MKFAITEAAKSDCAKLAQAVKPLKVRTETWVKLSKMSERSGRSIINIVGAAVDIAFTEQMNTDELKIQIEALNAQLAARNGN